MREARTFTFDRTLDISKFDGCNTRGVEYRWDVFGRHLRKVRPGSNVLDFGAGSLRESFELARRGFSITSIDIDLETLEDYRAKYDWPAAVRLIADGDMFSALGKLGTDRFSLITCFDVLEHLENPSSALQSLSARLADDGLLFVTVPNGRTLFEIVWAIDLRIARATGRNIRLGEPHLQRNSPARWRAIIEQAGLSILDHDMQIGFFANNVAALVQVPLALAGRILRKAGFGFDGLAVSERIVRRLGPGLDFLDRRTRFLHGLYGWNLFVLSRKTEAEALHRHDAGM